MSKQAFSIFRAFTVLITMVIFLFLSLFMVIDFVIVFPMNKYILFFYGTVMLVCLFSLLGTMFAKFCKVCYVAFFVSFTVYLAMYHFNTAVIDEHGADRCLDSGRGVWDYQEHRCRTDCWHWSWEKGCEKQ